MITVIDPGGLTTVQDLGRPGYAHLGVPPSGAVDRDALALGNRLVGTSEAAAGLEITLVGPRLRFDVPATIALTGAPLPAAVDGRRIAPGAVTHVAAGSVLESGTATSGLRSYLCVRGGLEVASVMGSRSSDVLTGLGPPPLSAGDRLPVGSIDAAWPGVDCVPFRNLSAEPMLHVLPGPHPEAFARSALETLTDSAYTVSPASNRIGMKLTGPPLDRISGEVATEGLITGAVQVPPSGQPIVFLNDHPTTGGYPVVAVVTTRSLRPAAQLRPGVTVRFTTAPTTF